VSAGEWLPAETRAAWEAVSGVRMIDGIGASEILYIFIGAAGDDVRPGATGKVLPGYRATVLDAQSKPCPPGVVGRLAVKGPTGCRYLADARQAEYVQNGWNVTGDAYKMDEDGYFWYQARADDMIISAGYNIAAPEVETALGAHPAVAECAVVGAPDERRGQIVMAYVVLNAGYTGDEAMVMELQEHVKSTIAPYKYPRAIEFLAALPRTATGKIQRFKLRQLAAT
jgi:2-aminobenzoate-CoA ligase